jgi:hypothetical protein
MLQTLSWRSRPIAQKDGYMGPDRPLRSACTIPLAPVTAVVFAIRPIACPPRHRAFEVLLPPGPPCVIGKNPCMRPEKTQVEGSMPLGMKN